MTTTSNDSFATFRALYEQGRRRYWTLQPKERVVVNFTAVLVIIALVWLAVIAPAQRIHALSQVQLDAKRSVLQWVKDNEARAIAAGKSGAGGEKKSGQSLMALVTQSSGQMGVALKRYEPEGNEKLRVWLEGQSFNNAIRWINTLQRQHGLTVVNVSIDATSQPGLVNAKFVLRG